MAGSRKPGRLASRPCLLDCQVFPAHEHMFAHDRTEPRRPRAIPADPPDPMRSMKLIRHAVTVGRHCYTSRAEVVRDQDEEKERVVVRFAGDSGDGIQFAGDRFAAATAMIGNDLVTLPDFPAEIRAPAGTLAGVSAFQIHFASRDILTPGRPAQRAGGDEPGGSRRRTSAELERGGIVIVNEDGFSERNLAQGRLRDQSARRRLARRLPGLPRPDDLDDRAGHRGHRRDQHARRGALEELLRAGLVSWMYSRPTDVTARWIEQKFASKPEIMEANLAAFRAGYNFGETAELLHVHYEVKPAPAEPGTYRGVNGTTAPALGLIAASVRSGLPLFLASYPITPASELLHELSRHKRFGVRTVQAEDEIAAANMALGAAFGGHLGVTATSGPGMDLKQETIGLAVALELPLLVIDVQRAGPSTGMPTKTEAADLLMAIHGRHGESPLPVVAASTPAHCFDAVLEAARIAVTYRTPVILLSDTFLANSSEPWRLPDAAELPEIDPASPPGRTGREFWPYLATSAWPGRGRCPGTPGLQHVIGGLEKEDGTGTSATSRTTTRG